MEGSTQAESKRLTFGAAVLRSGLVSTKQLQRATELAEEKDDASVAAVLVRSGLITQYQAQQLQAGRSKLTLGPYLITDWIGQGGMGQVFKAVHNVMGRECAVKVLPLEKSTPESRDAFRREIRVQAGLDSPYVVRAFDAGHDGNVHYLVTEYVPGTDLRRLVRNQGPLPMQQAARIISHAAFGLQYAHELGLIHRDVKPGNILVTPSGQAKVSDIGLAAWTMGLDADPRAGKIVGTADYLSPEQIRNPRSMGPASDIYSLGCTLYYSVTGKVPFPGGDSKSKCRRHCEQTPWHPRRFAAELSEDFVDVIADMMEKDPLRRIASAAEVAERLEPWSDTGLEAIDRPIERHAWTPPPPPSEQPSEDDWNGAADLPLGDEKSESGGHSDSGSKPLVPIGNDLAVTSLEGATRPRPSHAMPIAIALAIAVPISLLVGAVIGFLVRGPQ